MRKVNFLVYVYSFVLFLISPPYFLWGTQIPVLLVIFLFLFSIPQFGIRKNKNAYISLSLLFIFYLYTIIISARLSIIVCLLHLIVYSIFLLSGDFLSRAFRCYSLLFSISLIPSLLVYFCVVWGDVYMDYSIISPLNTIKSYEYIQYPFLVVSQVSDFVYFRFCAYYDEPGVVGSIASLLLIGNRFNLRLWENWPILIAGLFSFSLFFYVILFGYIFLYMNIRSKIYALLCILILLIILKNNEVVDQLVFGRLKWTDDGLSGDNRTSAFFDQWFQKYISTPTSIVGLGGGESLKINYGGASYKDLIVDYGFVGITLFFTGMFLFYLKLRLYKDYMLVVLLLLCTIYQRPFVFDYLYMFLLIAIISLVSTKKS